MEKETSDFVQTLYLCVFFMLLVIKGVVCGINWLAFGTETVSGHCEVGTDFLRIVQMNFVLQGRAISQTVCRWLFAGETRLRFRAVEICGAQSGTETHFSASSSVSFHQWYVLLFMLTLLSQGQRSKAWSLRTVLFLISGMHLDNKNTCTLLPFRGFIRLTYEGPALTL
jgi:hypothetical protein